MTWVVAKELRWHSEWDTSLAEDSGRLTKNKSAYMVGCPRWSTLILTLGPVLEIYWGITKAFLELQIYDSAPVEPLSKIVIAWKLEDIDKRR